MKLDLNRMALLACHSFDAATVWRQNVSKAGVLVTFRGPVNTTRKVIIGYDIPILFDIDWDPNYSAGKR